jgi:hypothetical protein
MADFTIYYHGTITLLQPHTTPCLTWLLENVSHEGWQWFANNSLAVEPRYLPNLVEGLIEAGFEQKED